MLPIMVLLLRVLAGYLRQPLLHRRAHEILCFVLILAEKLKSESDIGIGRECQVAPVFCHGLDNLGGYLICCEQCLHIE